MGERRRNANIIPKDPIFTLFDCGCRTIQFVRRNPADAPRPLIIDGANAILAAVGRQPMLNKPNNPITCKKLLALIRLIIFCDFEVIVVIPNSFILNQQTSVHLEPLIEMGIVKKCPIITYDDNECFIEAQQKRGTVLSNDQFKDLKVIGVDYRHFIEQHSVILIVRENDDPTFGNFYTSDGHYVSDVVFDFGSSDYNRYFVEPGQEDYEFLKKQEKKRLAYWPEKKKEILCFIDDALIDITLFEAGKMKKKEFITKKYRKAEVEVYRPGKKLPKKTEPEQKGPVVRDYVDPFGLRIATDVDYSNFKELNVYDSRTKVFNRRERPNQNIYDWEKLLKEQEKQKAGEKETANKSPEKPSTSQPAGSSAASNHNKVRASTQRLQQVDQKKPLEEKKMKEEENAFTAYNSQVSINLRPLLDSSDEEDNGKKPVQGTSHKGTFYPRQTGKPPNRKNSSKQSGQGTNTSKCNQRGNHSSADSQ